MRQLDRVLAKAPARPRLKGRNLALVPALADDSADILMMQSAQSDPGELFCKRDAKRQVGGLPVSEERTMNRAAQRVRR